MGLIEQIAIEIAIVVVIEKHGLCGETREIETICRGAFFKFTVALVNEQLVTSLQVMGIGNSADINVQQSVAIDVGHGNTCTPVGIAGYAGFICYVLEFKIAFIKIEFIMSLDIGGKIDIG